MAVPVAGVCLWETSLRGGACHWLGHQQPHFTLRTESHLLCAHSSAVLLLSLLLGSLPFFSVNFSQELSTTQLRVTLSEVASVTSKLGGI